MNECPFRGSDKVALNVAYWVLCAAGAHRHTRYSDCLAAAVAAMTSPARLG